jgi:formiminotetrahydrofolate cyclodeaminase
MELILWDKAKQAIEEARNIDEVKDIRDRAEAFRMYAKQARESLVVQNKVAEIKLRCERRIGEMTSVMPKAVNQYKVPSASSGEQTKSSAIKDAGFTSQEVSKYETIASLPDETFEKYVAEVKASNEELTTIGLVRLAKRLEGKEETRTDCNHRWTCTLCGLRR